MTDVVRVLLADDHDVVRRGLTALLDGATGFAVVGAASDGAEAVALAVEQAPDVILMDLSMPGMDGIEATRQVVSDRPDARVVILTSFSDRERILDALDAGAVGYLLKDSEPDELLRGIQAAARGVPAGAEGGPRRADGTRRGPARSRAHGPRAGSPRAARRGPWPTSRSPAASASPRRP